MSLTINILYIIDFQCVVIMCYFSRLGNKKPDTCRVLITHIEGGTIVTWAD